MLVRAYRLTDRLGVVLLKSILAVCEVTVAGLSVVWRGILLVLSPLIAVVGWIVSRQKPPSARQRARAGSVAGAGDMARRATQSELVADVGLTEDPLRVQNRLLSGLLVLVLAALVGVVLWATSPGRVSAPPVIANVNALAPDTNPLAATPITTPITLPSPVPTATPLPSLLEVRGTLAYVVREKAQTDLWVIPVGSRAPLRLTNHPADDRDPSWSPGGEQLAYASRQDGNWEIYIYDVASGATTRMTYDLSFQGAPHWSPDGKWLVYESYQGNNLDIYVMSIDGSQPPIRLTDDPAPDFSPAWSPDGRSVAFVSWRDGNQDIYLFSLDDQSVTNVTGTPTRYEDYPTWNPDIDSQLIAYSALDEGLEKVFVKQVSNPNSAAQVLGRGHTPTWSPDGKSLVYAVDSADSTHLIAAPFADTGVTTEIIPVPQGSTQPTWTVGLLPPAFINSGGLPATLTEPLFIEQENPTGRDPMYRLSTLNNVTAPNPVLSERVNDSFNALRERVLEEAGWDFLGELEDAFWSIDRPPQPGEERRNWLMTGRSFAVNRNAIVGFPPPLEVVREDLNVDTYWRLYLRVADSEQTGRLGEPLRRMPWDFAARNQGDVEAYDQGGRLRAEIPTGYYIDLTQLAAAYGWSHVAAGEDWRANFNSTNYWLFQKREGLDWYTAMRELYTDAQMGGFGATATPVLNQVAGQSSAEITVQVQPAAQATAQAES